MKLEVTIDSNNFSNLSEFYDEIESKLTKGLTWKIGRNLNAFNDVLHGGFGVHDYDEEFTLIWKHSKQSIEDLGYTETLLLLNNVLLNCHPSNSQRVKDEISLCESGNGPTLYETILEIIKDHNHVTLILD